MAIDLGVVATMGEFPPVWLDEEHEWNGDQGNDEQEDLSLLLVVDYFCLVWILWLTLIDEHGNHELDDGWSLLALGIPVGEPLHDDHGVHETEESHQKSH